jgi:hypothetical protein
MSDLWRWCRGGAATTVVESYCGGGVARRGRGRGQGSEGDPARWDLGVADECTVYGGEEKVTDF